MPELLAKYDFEEERLDIKNFVVNSTYLTFV